MTRYELGRPPFATVRLTDQQAGAVYEWSWSWLDEDCAGTRTELEMACDLLPTLCRSLTAGVDIDIRVSRRPQQNAA